MNFIGTSGGSNSGSGSRRRQQHQEEDEEERQNTGQLFPPPSSSPSSSHHQNQHQPSSFHRQPPYHHQNTGRGGWVFDGHEGGGGGEPSPRLSESMMVDYLAVPVPPSDNNSNNNNDDDNQESGGGMMVVVEREHMFDKVVTPSDVGKLNRLVIPKQHAERYFPLDSSTNDKGLLLNFEDRHGKPWRFRYSYWNSSQSYVMTKGWSRFVKDKKLDAGDIVSFQRGVGSAAKDRLFIDWRHRPDAPVPPVPHHQFSFHNRNMNIHPWNPLFLQSQPANSMNHSSLMLQPPLYSYSSTGGPNYHSIGAGSVVNHVNQGGSGSLIYFRSGGGGGVGFGIGMDPPPPPPPSVVFESVPVVHGKAAAKRLRLFGVNMDCPISDDDQDYDPTTSAPIPMGNYHHALGHFPPSASSSSTIPYLQLGPNYAGETRYHETDAYTKSTKSSSSHMSLDLDI